MGIPACTCLFLPVPACSCLILPVPACSCLILLSWDGLGTRDCTSKGDLGELSCTGWFVWLSCPQQAKKLTRSLGEPNPRILGPFTQAPGSISPPSPGQLAAGCTVLPKPETLLKS